MTLLESSTRSRARIPALAIVGALLLTLTVNASERLVRVCPPVGIQQRAPDFSPGGIILTAFDKSSIWVYDIEGNRRYPLPDTKPCGTNCRLSRDARWITYVDAANYTYSRMRLDGTERTLLVDYAADVEWWSDDRLLVWTPGHVAYLQTLDGEEREYLDVRGVVSVQPGGHWGVAVERDGDDFIRSLSNLALRNLPGIAEQRVLLGKDVPYFSDLAWSPDGSWLAFVSQGQYDAGAKIAGAELFGVRPDDSQPTQWTNLNSSYGAVRINGHAAQQLSWSPDSTRIAFWVIELLGPDPESNTGSAVIHILDIATGEIRAYCGYSTTEHTPNPPRLIWSPDGSYLAFGGNIPGDDKGYLLLALDTESGIFTELSNGVFPALGNSDLIAWGLPPR